MNVIKINSEDKDFDDNLDTTVSSDNDSINQDLPVNDDENNQSTWNKTVSFFKRHAIKISIFVFVLLILILSYHYSWYALIGKKLSSLLNSAKDETTDITVKS